MNLLVELAPQHKSGLPLRNPVMLAAGTAGYGVGATRSIEIPRLGALVTSSITLHAQAGTGPPLLVETASGLLSALEWANPGVRKVLKTCSSTWASWQTPIIVSLAGSTLADFVDLAARLDGAPGVAALELNTACPDRDADGALFGADPARVSRLVAAVRRQSALPLLVKLAPCDGDPRPIALAAAEAGADAITLGAALAGLCIDVRHRRPALLGSLCGPAIKPLALRLLYDIACEMRRAYPLVPLIGGGGISHAHDALEFLMAGATAVQVGSASFVNPRAGVEIVEGIEAFLQQEGINDVEEIIGVALPRS